MRSSASRETIPMPGRLRLASEAVARRSFQPRLRRATDCGATGGVSVSPGTTLTIAGAGATTISTAPLSLAAATFDGPSQLAVAGPVSVEITSSPQLVAESKLTVNGGMLRLRSHVRGPLQPSALASPRRLPPAQPSNWPAASRPSRPVRPESTSSTTARQPVSSSPAKTSEPGSIDGGGSTAVAPSADLTADHIIQSALIIEGAPGQPGLVTIAVSDSAGNPIDDTSTNALAGIVDGPPIATESRLSADRNSSGPPAPITSSLDAESNGENPLPVPEPSALTAAPIAISALSLPSIRRRLDGAVS